MYKHTVLVSFDRNAAESRRQDVLSKLGAVPAARALLEPTLPGVFNGGDFVWHLQYGDEASFRSAMTTEAARNAIAALADRQVVAGTERVTYGEGPRGERKV